MNQVSLIVYSPTNLAAAKEFFRIVTGAEPYVDSPYYVGYKTDTVEIGLTPQSTGAMPGGLAYWTVADIHASVKALINAGGTIVQEITDVAQGLLVASVQGADGVIVGLRQLPD